VIGRDDTADGGMTKGMRGSALHVSVTALVTVGTAMIGAFSESVSDSKPVVEPGTFFFVTPSCSIYGKSFIHGEGRGVSDG
jgi:hypothetical protein